MYVAVVAHTNTDKVVELAGRLCKGTYYENFNKPTDGEFIERVVGLGHLSILRHYNLTFYVEGVSRACCYDDQTEVLTSEGWKLFKDLDKTESFFTLCPSTHEIELQKASSYIEEEYNGRMYLLESSKVNLCVTPSHRMLYYPYDTQKSKRLGKDGKNKLYMWKIDYAKNIAKKRVAYTKIGKWIKEDIEFVTIPSIIRPHGREGGFREYPELKIEADLFLEFLGYYISEGSLSHGNGSSYAVCLCQNEGETFLKMKKIIEKMGFKCQVRNRDRFRQMRFCSIQLYHYLKLLGKSYQKYIPIEILKNISQRQSKILLESLILGDGHTDDGHSRYYTTSKRLSDNVQELVLKAGYAANIRIDNRVGDSHVWNGREIKRNYQMYIVAILYRQNRPLVNHGGKKNDSWIEYEGKIYCVSVPNTILYVRRNGKPVWCGNSHQLVRHKAGIDFTQESQRYVHVDGKSNWSVIPPHMAKCKESINLYSNAMWLVRNAYEELISMGVAKEDARFLLPNATGTKLVITANAQALHNFFDARICCYDDQTEVLTSEGWKFFKDINGSEKFYSLDLEEGNCELVNSKKIIKEPYKGEMIRVKSQSIDLLVTPNHYNLVAYSYHKKDYKMDLATNSLKKDTVLMKKNCLPISGKIDKTFFINGLVVERGNQSKRWERELEGRNVDIKDFFKFLGMYISDGWVTRAGYHYNIGICKGDETIIDKYKTILERITPNTVAKSKDGNCWKITLHDRVLYEFLKPLGKAREKHIPKFVWKYDSSVLECLYEGLCDGDMSKRKIGKVYYTSSKQLANDVQRLCLHLGMSATIGVDDRKDSHLIKDRNGKFREIKKSSVSYYISINKAKNEPIIKKLYKQDPFSTQNYDGMVYCVELEKNHILYVRRNGRTVWSGNSRAQWEIRELAIRMYCLAMKFAPNLFKMWRPRCENCPEKCGNPIRKILNESINNTEECEGVEEFPNFLEQGI